MKELCTLLAPAFWSMRNSIVRFDRSFYKKVFFYFLSCGLFLFLVTSLMNAGMRRLQSLSSDVFNVLLVKGYSLIFVIIFFIQIVDGFVVSLNTYYQSRDLEGLITSPVSRTALFFSRLFETHIKASWMLVIFGVPLLVSSGLLYHAGFSYYIYATVVFAAFSIIPVNIGTIMTMFVSSLFSVRRFKKLLVSASIVVVVLLVTLLRVLKPERFVNPELFANLTLFISELRTPSFILLPSRWLSDSLFAFLRGSFNFDALIVLVLLFLTSYVTSILLLGIFKKCHYKGWTLLQEGDIILRGRVARARRSITFPWRQAVGSVIGTLSKAIGVQSAVLVKKDFLSQLRDAQNVHQVLIIGSLISVYLFSVASLPLNWEGYAVQLKYIISFFNLGLVLIIVAAICSRLVYPVVSSEAISSWIMKTSPMTPKRYVWTKFFFFLIPVFVFSQVLTIFSSFFIGIEGAFRTLIIVTTALLSMSLVSIAITFGVSEFKLGAVANQEQVRAGSTAYMFVSVFLILFTLALEIVPIFLYFLKEATKGEFTQRGWQVAAMVIVTVLLANLVATLLSIRLGIKRFGKLD